MTLIPSREARDRIAELLNRVAWRDETFVLTRHGKPVAKLAPVGADDEHQKKEGDQ